MFEPHIIVEVMLSIPNNTIMNVTRRLQVASVDYEPGAVLFHRGHFIDGLTDPQQYFATWGIPWHQIIWIEQPFGDGVRLPNFKHLQY